MEIAVIALLVAVIIGIVAYMGVLVANERRRHREMLHRAIAVVSSVAAVPVPDKPGMVGWLVGAAKQLAARFGEAVKPKEAKELTKNRAALVHAGFRQPNALEIFWGIKMGGAFVGLVVGSLVVMTGRLPTRYSVLAVVCCVALFFYLPGIVLDYKVRQRQKAVLHGLPDALDLLVVCVEAGMGLDAAMYRVCVELAPKEPVISGELRLLTLELRAGKARREALKNLSARVGLEEMGSLVAMLIQTDLFGTSIAQTLRVYAEAMRIKRFQLAEEMAAKLPVKLLLPLVFFIFPTLLIVILGPAGLSIAQMFGGVNR